MIPHWRSPRNRSVESRMRPSQAIQGRSWPPKDVTEKIRAGEELATTFKKRYSDELVGRFARWWEEAKGRIMTIGEPCINDPGGVIHLPKLPGKPNARGP